MSRHRPENAVTASGSDTPAGHHDPAPTPVLYIAGAGRSGSTLLEGMLGAAPGFAGVGEVRYIWHRAFQDNQLCSCGRPFADCPFWHGVVRRAFGSGRVDPDRMLELRNRVDRVRHLPRLVWPRLRDDAFRDAHEEYGAVLTRLYRGMLEASGRTVVIDSSKDAPHAYLLDSLPGIRLFVIHLVRDSRAVAYSWQRVRRRPEIHWEEAYMPTFTPSSTASEWNRTNTWYELLARRSHRYLRIHYEDLARDPAAALRLIRDRFGDLEPAFAQVGAAGATAPYWHSVSGNPLRFAGALPAVSLDTEWVSAMDRRSRRTVELRTLPLLARYGYLTSRRPAALTDGGAGGR
jgi:hypothetical protein